MTEIISEAKQLQTQYAAGGLVYISLKVANNEIAYPELIEWIYRRIEHGNV